MAIGFSMVRALPNKYLDLVTSQNGKKSLRISKRNGKRNIRLNSLKEWLKITKIIVSIMKKILELIKSFYNWLNTDGLLHISFSSMIITFSFPLIKWWSVGLAVLVGLAKEAYDILVKKSDPKLSIHDLICDCIGIIMTVVLILVGYAG